MTPRARITRPIAKTRVLARPEFALALCLVPLLVGYSCFPDTAPNDVRTIEDFVQCLNNRIIGGDIVDAVQCIPCGCSLTLTLSEGSAQPACNDQGCPMPRVLLNCPGPPQFQPSFSLCIADTGGGLDRVEIGQTINAQGDMRMGDVHIDPAGYGYTDPSAPVSKADGSGPGDSAQCWTCHDHDNDTPIGEEAISSPSPYQIFDTNCVTDTDEPCQLPDAGDGDCRTQGTLEQKSFAQICQCLDNKNDLDEEDPLYPKLLRARGLCHALMDYQSTRGICGSEECPQHHGPDCSALATGYDCNPYEIPAGAATEHTGYTCQEVEPGVKQCVSSRVCVDYSITGGGKFIGEDGVSLLRLLITGRTAVDDCPVCDTTDIDADVRAFNHAADTLVNGVQLSSIKATDLGGGDLSVEAKGAALVNGGGPVNITLDASKTAGTPAFEIDDTDAPASLAGGTGEAGRSDFQLNQTPMP
jgi:hypothetical protein